MLPKAQLSIVLSFLKNLRRKRERVTDIKSDESDLNDVIEALEKASYVIVPTGSIEAMRGALEEINGRIKKKLADKGESD